MIKYNNILVKDQETLDNYTKAIGDAIHEVELKAWYRCKTKEIEIKKDIIVANNGEHTVIKIIKKFQEILKVLDDLCEGVNLV